MTANVLFHGYYYRYAQHRKNIKDLISAENLTEAKNKLDAAIAEHLTKYGTTLPETRHDFNYGEVVTLEHAKRHLDMVVVDGDIPYIDGITGETRTQITKIIEILLHNPTNTDL